MYNSNYIWVLLMIVSSLFLFSSCGQCHHQTLLHESQPSRESNLPAYLQKRIGHSSQVILVRNIQPHTVSVQVIALERKNDRWRSPFLPMEGVIGRKGFAPPGEKREGDGRTPSGIFLLGAVFGYEPSFPTMMPYRQVTVDDLWVDDANAADYNRLVKRGSTRASSFEVMRRDDDLYKYGIVVEYNTDPVIKGYGSAIFFHLWRGKEAPTEGCVALSVENLTQILRWLKPEAKPLAVLGTNVTIDDMTQ
jgi:L,D-peptidoglycan transpeptidase YkuD (ErfK/YbiS/YcfS/YnhG family)